MTDRLGQLMISIEGTALDEVTRERLCHPDVGGVIIFSRNYENPGQLRDLCRSIRELRSPSLLIAVDQEGGVVQRLVAGFTRLPAMASIGALFEEDQDEALSLAEAVGEILAIELGEAGIDFSFTPVIDLACRNKAIGSRAFHADPAIVRKFAEALASGLSLHGMRAVAKHFPGHSGVVEDPHFDLPVDSRGLAELRERDMSAYENLESGHIDGVMTCHVIFPEVDEVPATFSKLLIEGELRQRLNFGGMIVSDDVMMGALSRYGAPRDRIIASREAGCDLVLLCNDDAAADTVLSAQRLPALSDLSERRLEKMRYVGYGDASVSSRLASQKERLAALVAGA